MTPTTDEPRYSVTDALAILDVPVSVLQMWCTPPTPGLRFYPLIRTHAPDGAGEPYVTFPTLAEAHMLAAFARSDLPARAPWTANTWLTRILGIAHPLISENLADDGAPALLDAAEECADPVDRQLLRDLVTATHTLRPTLGPLLGDRVRGNVYRQGAVGAVTLDGYGATSVVVDREVNDGAPSIMPHRAPLADVLARARRGEPPAAIIGEHRLTATELHDVLIRHEIPIPA